MTYFAVISGGGTAGHVLPALAIAEGLVDAGHDQAELFYIGAQRGIETRLVPATNIAHTFFDVVGLQRDFSRASLLSNLKFLPKLWRARGQAITLFKNIQPKVVVSVGGYASLPAVLAARRQKIPIVVVSYDRCPGQSSQLTARFAAGTATAFPDSTLPRAVHTGAPVRRVIRQVDRVRDRSGARQRLGIDEDRFFIGVIGGSLGSGVLNNAIRSLVEKSVDDQGLAIRHIVGERFGAHFVNPLDAHAHAGVVYQVLAYEENMQDIYAGADLVIGRGGAGTVADIATTGTPAILIPWLGASADHQTQNVQWLVDNAAAIGISETNIVEDLVASIAHLRGNRQRLSEIASNAFAMGACHRAGRIAELIEHVAQAAV